MISKDEFADLEPRAAKPTPKDLTALGVAELQDYIVGLEAEIARARAAITAKEAQKSAAEAFLKKAVTLGLSKKKALLPTGKRAFGVLRGTFLV